MASAVGSISAGQLLGRSPPFATLSQTCARTRPSWRRVVANGQSRKASLYYPPQRHGEGPSGETIIVKSIPVSGPQPSANDSQPSAMNPAQPGQIAGLIASMHSKISAELATENVRITDAYGDGRHVSIEVVSPLFEGQSAVKRQRMVYKAIWLELQEAVHAVDSMTTKTPAEAGIQ